MRCSSSARERHNDSHAVTRSLSTMWEDGIVTSGLTVNTTSAGRVGRALGRTRKASRSQRMNPQAVRAPCR